MSNRRCCVPGCVNNIQEGCKEILHKFPNPDKNRNLFNSWVYAIDGELLQLENKHIFKHRRVCHIHFEEKYWCRNNRLGNIALPTKYMPGLSLSKFSGNERTLREIQIPLPSTSRAPVAPLQYVASEDVEMAENLDPRIKSLGENADVQLHHVTVCGEIKEKPESAPRLDFAPAQFSASSIVEDVQMKSSTELAVSTRPVKSAPIQSGVKSTIDVLIKKDLGSRKQQKSLKIRKNHVTRVVVTPTEHELYKKIKQVSVKLSKCRNRAKKQALKIKKT